MEKMAKQYVCHEEKEPCQVKIMRVAADLEFQRMFSSLANFENAFVNFIIQFMIFHKFELGNSMIDSQYLPHTFSSPCPNWSICLLQNSSFVQITDFTNQPLMAISQKAILTIELLQNNDVIISDQEAMSSILGLLSMLCCNANYLGDFCDPKCWGEFLVLNFVCSKCSWCTKYLKKFYLKWKAQGRHQIFLNFISPKNVYYGIFCQTIA